MCAAGVAAIAPIPEAFGSGILDLADAADIRRFPQIPPCLGGPVCARRARAANGYTGTPQALPGPDAPRGGRSPVQIRPARLPTEPTIVRASRGNERMACIGSGGSAARMR